MMCEKCKGAGNLSYASKDLTNLGKPKDRKRWRRMAITEHAKCESDNCSCQHRVDR